MSDSMTTGDHRPFTARLEHMLRLGTLGLPLQDQSNTPLTDSPHRLRGGGNDSVGNDRAFAESVNVAHQDRDTGGNERYTVKPPRIESPIACINKHAHTATASMQSIYKDISALKETLAGTNQRVSSIRHVPTTGKLVTDSSGSNELGANPKATDVTKNDKIHGYEQRPILRRSEGIRSLYKLANTKGSRGTIQREIGESAVQPRTPGAYWRNSCAVIYSSRIKGALVLGISFRYRNVWLL